MFCGPVIFPRHGGGDGRRQLDPAPPKGCCCVGSNSWTFWIVHTCQYWQLRPTPRAARTRAFVKDFLLCWPQDGSKLDFLASLVQFYAFTSDIKFFIPKKIDFLSIFGRFSGQHEAPNPPKIHLKSIQNWYQNFVHFLIDFLLIFDRFWGPRWP